MQKKLSKHFIYKWLSEDAYGEYLFHHKSKFSSKLLLNLWNFLLGRRNTQRASLIANTWLPRQVEFLTAVLRYNFLQQSNLNLKGITRGETFSYASRVREFFINNLLLGKDKCFTRTSTLIKYLRKNSQIRRSYFSRFIRGQLRAWITYKTFSLSSLKRHVFKRRRMHRRRKVNYLSLIPHKRKLKYLNKRVGGLKTQNNGIRLALQRKKTNFINRSRYFNSTKKTLIKNTGDLGAFWRFYLFNKKPLLTNNNSASFFLNLAVPRFQVNLILATSWDALAYKLKHKIRRFSQLKSIKKKGVNKTASHAKLYFRGVFKKPTIVVKKNEVQHLLKFRLLNYFNLLTTAKDYQEALIMSSYYSAKTLQLPSLAYLEFQLSSILLRSGFFENGYVANALIKRNVFFLNGLFVKTNVVTTVWDMISLAKPLWWVVYARFLNFFHSFFAASSISKLRSKVCLRRLLKLRVLFRKFDYKTKLSTKGRLSTLLSTKNLVFALPPSYMEVSYKLFTIIIYKLINSTKDVNRAINLRGLKTAVASQTLRFSLF